MRKTICYLALLLSLWSCEFNPSETVFTELEAPNTDRLSQVVFADTLDSLYIFDRTEIIFDLDFKEFELYQIEFSIDDEEKRLSEGEDGVLSYVLDPRTLENGSHRALLRAVTSTETNSLADNLEQEVFLIEKEFTIYIDLIPPPEVSIDRIFIEDGILKVAWQAPDKQNFLQLELNRFADPASGGVTRDVLVFPRDREEYLDIFYAGQEITYSVEIVGYNYRVEGPEMTFSFPGFPVEVSLPTDSSLLVEWSDFPLVNDRLSFEVGSFTTSPRLSERFDKAESGSQLIEDIAIPFGRKHNFALSVKAPQILAGYWETSTFHIGEELPFTFSNVGYNSNTGDLYFVRDDVLSRNDFATYTEKTSVPIIADDYFFPPGSDKIYGIRDATLSVIDPVTLQASSRLDLSDLTGIQANFVSMVSFSDNGLIFFRLGSPSRNTLSICVLDIDRREIVHLEPAPGFLHGISRDGTVFAAGPNIYRNTNGVVEVIHEVEDLASIPANPQVTPDGASIFYRDTRNGNTDIMLRYSIATGEVMGSFGVLDSFGGGIGFDPVDDVLFGASGTRRDTRFVLFDESYDIIRTEYILQEQRGQDYFYIGNKLFSNTGFVKTL